MPPLPRLSGVETAILHLLVAHGEMYGLELVAASPLLKRGTIYVTLGRMAEKGLVTSRQVKAKHEAGLPRRLFRASADAERLLRAQQIAESAFAKAVLA